MRSLTRARHPLVLVPILVLLWPLAPPARVTAAASPLSAYGTATIDGKLGAGEWDGAARMTIPFRLPVPGDPIEVPASFLVMNDAENLYLALQVGRPLDYASLSVEFDNDDDGTFSEEGDDGVGGSSGSGESKFFDFARLRCVGDDGSQVARCAPADDSTDALHPLAGTIDGGSASSQPSGTDFVELFHPLDSDDDARDFSLGPGSTVGFQVSIQLIDDGYGLPCDTTSCGSSTSARGRLTIATPTTGPRPGPRATAQVTAPTAGTRWVRSSATVTITGGPKTTTLTYWTAPIARGGSRALCDGETMGATTVAGSTARVLISAEGTTLVHFFAARADGRGGPWGTVTVRVDATHPEVTDPVASSFVLGATLGKASTLVTWEPVDAFSGVARSILQELRERGPWVTITTTGSAVRRSLRVGDRYAYRVRAVDAVGNSSLWRFGPWMKAAVVDASSKTFTLSGPWTAVPDPDASGRSLLTSSTVGASATRRIFANAIALVMPTGPGHGSSTVTLDGGDAKTVDLASPTADKRVVWTDSWSVATWHTLEIRVPEGSTGRVDLDAIATLAPSDPVDNAMTAASAHLEAEGLPASVSGAGAWIAPVAQAAPADLIGRWNGAGQLVWRAVKPGTLTLAVPVPHGRFRAVVFVSKGPEYGIAVIRFGPAPPITVDLYAPKLIRHVLYFDAILQTGRGPVPFEVTVTGKNPASSGLAVGVDLFLLAAIP